MTRIEEAEEKTSKGATQMSQQGKPHTAVGEATPPPAVQQTSRFSTADLPSSTADPPFQYSRPPVSVQQTFHSVQQTSPFNTGTFGVMCPWGLPHGLKGHSVCQNGTPLGRLVFPSRRLAFANHPVPPISPVPPFRALPTRSPTLSSMPPHPLRQNSPHPTAKRVYSLCRMGIPFLRKEYTLSGRRVYSYRPRCIPSPLQGVYPFWEKSILFSQKVWGIWVERVGDSTGEGGAFRQRGSGAERQRLAIIR